MLFQFRYKEIGQLIIGRSLHSQNCPPMSQFQAVIFDLDGTLLDTLRDIAIAANRVLSECGFPVHPVDAYRQFVGDGVSMLFQRAVAMPTGADEQLIKTCVGAFTTVYREQWDRHSKPYKGIPELIDILTERRIPLSVLSNKPHEFTKLCVDRYFPDGCFRQVLGQRPEIARKPDPAGAIHIADRIGIPPAKFLFVGDTDIDIRTAIAAGMEPVGVRWGFRPARELSESGARILLDRPADLLQYFLS